MRLRATTRIGQRLALSFGLLIVMSSFAGFFGFMNNRTLVRQQDQLFRETAAANNYARDIRTNLVQLHRNMKDIALAQTSAEADQARARAAVCEQQAHANLDSLAACAPYGKEAIASLREDLYAWQFVRDWVVDLKEQGSSTEAAFVTLHQSADQVEDVESHVQQLLALANENHNLVSTGIVRRQHVASRYLAAVLLFSGLLTLGIGVQVTRRMVGPLKRLVEFADGIREGHLDERLRLTRRDEIGALGAALDHMADSVQASRQELNANRRELEKRVEERTAELVKLHESLNVEFDIRERMAAQLMESEERLDLVITGANDGFWDWPDLSSPEMWWSPRVYTMLGLDQLTFWPELDVLLELCHAEDRSALAEALHTADAEGDAPDLDFRVRNAAGEYLWFRLRGQIFRDTAGTPYRMSGSFQDITKRKWAEAQLMQTNIELEALNNKLRSNQNALIQAEKMSSLGQLAAGVAHEINNPVGFISSNLGTMTEYTRALREVVQPMLAAPAGTDPLSDPAIADAVRRALAAEDFVFLFEDIDQLLSESLDGTERITEIVRSLKSFARPDEDTMSTAQINDGLEMALKMTWNNLKYKCEIIKELGDIPPIFCNIGRLNQVFMNLLVNAAHSISQEGRITLRTTHRNGQVVVEISDTGAGIPAEVQSRIFEPFFTTKPVGEGTGLGLSISHGIVQDHHGSISLSSEVGRGTTFTIRIPDDLDATFEMAGETADEAEALPV